MAGNKQTGRKPGPGRPKGSRNKFTRSVKEALERAFEQRGGDKALTAWANENPTDFYKLWGRMLPSEVQASLEHSGELVVRVIRQAGGGSTRGA